MCRNIKNEKLNQHNEIKPERKNTFQMKKFKIKNTFKFINIFINYPENVLAITNFQRFYSEF